MRAAVGFRHHGYDGDAGGSPNGLRPELRQESLALSVWHRGDHLDQLRRSGEAVAAASSRLKRVEVHILASPAALHHGVHDLRYGPDARLLLRQRAGRRNNATPTWRRLLPRRGGATQRRRVSRGRHCGRSHLSRRERE